MTAQDQEAHEIKETSPLNLTGLLPDKFTLETQGVKTDQFKKQRLTRRASKKKKNWKTKKQSPNERKAGNLRNNAKGNRGKSIIIYGLQAMLSGS